MKYCILTGGGWYNILLYRNFGGGRGKGSGREGRGLRRNATAGLRTPFAIVRHRGAMPAVRRRPQRRTATRLLGSCTSRRRRRTADDLPTPICTIIYCIPMGGGRKGGGRDLRRCAVAGHHHACNSLLYTNSGGSERKREREKAGCSLRRDTRGGPPPPPEARAAPAEPQYTYILYGVNFAKDIAYRPHCEKCGKATAAA